MRHLDQAIENAFSQPIGSFALNELMKSDYRKPTLQEVCTWLWDKKGVFITTPFLCEDKTCYECTIQYIDVSTKGKGELPIKGSGGTREDAINDALHIILSCLNEPIDHVTKPTLWERIERWLNVPPSPLKPDEDNWRSCKIRLQGAARYRETITSHACSDHP